MVFPAEMICDRGKDYTWCDTN